MAKSDNEAQTAVDNGEKPVFSLADLVIDTGKQSVSRAEAQIELPELSYRLLACLAAHAPETAGKDQLIEEVWQGTVVSDETLTQRVRLLRQALAMGGQEPDYIAAVRNRGYRLKVPVRKIDPLPARPGSVISMRWILAAGLAMLAMSAWLIPKLVTDEPGPAGPVSLAVLPFADLSAEADSRYFADGVHEELIATLSQLNALSIVSRTSVLPYRDASLSVPDIARALGVDAVLEGSVRRDGNQVRVTTQLIDGHTDRHLWSQTFDRELTVKNLFAIQTEMATAIANALRLSMPPDGRSQTVELPTGSIEAYDLYLLGRYHTLRLTPQDLEKGVSLLTEAVERDPSFAEAWARLGWAYSFQGSGYGVDAPGEIIGKARGAALRALSLDPGLADAHSLYADILTWYDWDWDAAEREYRATLQLDPDNVLGYALFLSTQLRHEEAIKQVNRLVRKYPGDEFIHINAAWRYLNAREYESAMAQAELARGHADYLLVRSWALMSLGKLAEANVLLERGLAADPANPNRISLLAVARARADRTAEARRLLGDLLDRSDAQYISPTLVAAVHFALEEPEAGFDWVEKAVGVRSRGVIFLQVDHAYDGYRDHPRYRALAAKLGFSD